MIHLYELRERRKMSFETPLLISVKNIDLSSGLKVVFSLSEKLDVSKIEIRRSSYDV